MTDAEMKAALERLDEGGGSQWECDLFNAAPWLLALAREALQARQSQPSMRMEVTPTPELMREFKASATKLIDERFSTELRDALANLVSALDCMKNGKVSIAVAAAHARVRELLRAARVAPMEGR